MFVPFLVYCAVPLLTRIPFVEAWINAPRPLYWCQPMRGLDEGLSMFTPQQPSNDFQERVAELERCVVALQRELGRVDAARLPEEQDQRVDYLAELLETGALAGSAPTPSTLGAGEVGENPPDATGDEEKPVTVAVHYMVRNECRERFLRLLREMEGAMQRLQGFVSMHTVEEVRDADTDAWRLRDPHFTVLFKFSSWRHLKRWQDCKERREFLTRMEELVRAKPSWTRSDEMVLERT